MNAPDAQILASIAAAHKAELAGEPKRWFLLSENRRGGLKLGIGMFNPGISRIADMFYVGEVTPITWEHAWLIIDAVNASFAVNRQKPAVAAELYPRFVRVVKALVHEAWRYDEEIKENEQVFHVSRDTLGTVEDLLDQLIGTNDHACKPRAVAESAKAFDALVEVVRMVKRKLCNDAYVRQTGIAASFTHAEVAQIIDALALAEMEVADD
jgi:hypothetical protein